ncbi:MAG: tripartite tricarboxylate transporter substrate binding protein, partial [Acetobacteraceae bacterium]|nr:tripartite tricarboxylate transporter substrate binding protein [Acetobacteraceae bacterium]
GGPLMNDIVAGHLPVGWTSTVSAMPHMGTGRVRVLAVSTATRSPFFPDAPTAQEQGVTEFDLSGWVALLGPRGLPEGVAARLLPALEQAYADAALQERLKAMGVERDLRPGPALLAAMQREDRIWTEAAARGHVRPQQ